jgi:hypothetical protein
MYLRTTMADAKEDESDWIFDYVMSVLKVSRSAWDSQTAGACRIKGRSFYTRGVLHVLLSFMQSPAWDACVMGEWAPPS